MLREDQNTKRAFYPQGRIFAFKTKMKTKKLKYKTSIIDVAISECHNSVALE
jgi:hypothetical protein